MHNARCVIISIMETILHINGLYPKTNSKFWVNLCVNNQLYYFHRLSIFLLSKVSKFFPSIHYLSAIAIALNICTILSLLCSYLVRITSSMKTSLTIHNYVDQGETTLQRQPRHPDTASGGCFHYKKTLSPSPIDRKLLYVIILIFFVLRHECHRSLLKFWLKQIFFLLNS